MNITYIIPTKGPSKHLDLCLQSIKESDETGYKIVLVTESKELHDKYANDIDYRVILTGNINFTDKINHGLWHIINKVDNNELVCLLNDDVIIFQPLVKIVKEKFGNTTYRGLLNPYSNCDVGWLHKSKMIMNNGEEIGIGLPEEWVTEKRLKLLKDYALWRSEILRSEKWNNINHAENIAFYCTFIDSDSVRTLGYLDSRMKMVCSDFEYCFRAHNHCKVGYLTNGFAFHFGAVTRKGDELRNGDAYAALDKSDTSVTNKKKRVLIFSGKSWEKWDVRNLYSGGIGGSETCLIYLARYLVQCGFDVDAVIDCDKDHVVDGVHYKCLDTFHYHMNDYDIVVSSRVPGLKLYPNSKNILWVHDISFFADGIKSANNYDKIVLLSDWHRDFWRQYGYDRKVVVIPDGLDTERFNINTEKKYGKIVYGSSWDRGLDNLIYVLEEVRKLGGNVNLHIFYGTYNLIETAKALRDNRLVQFYESMKEKIKEHSWIYDHQRVDQRTLAEQYSSAFAWVYPTYFAETHCITATECMAAGLPIVHNGYAGLDKYSDTGVCIKQQLESVFFNPDARIKLRPYVDIVMSLLSDPKLWKDLSLPSKRKAEQFKWEKIVKEKWVPLLLE